MPRSGLSGCLFLLTVGALAAGCLGATVTEVPAVEVDGWFGPARPVDLEVAGAEPVVAVGPDGVVYVQAIGGGPEGVRNSLWRSRDEGRTWTQVAPAGGARDEARDGFMAVAPSGTVYLANAEAFRLRLYRSDDEGDTWLRLRQPVRDPIHRMWLLPEGDRTLHLAVDRVAVKPGILYARSDDAGHTWTTPVLVDGDTIHGSNLARDPVRDVLHLVRVDEDDVAHLHSSRDGGRTWAAGARVADLGAHAPPWTTLVADDAGNLYFVWSGAPGLFAGGPRVHYVASGDGGLTWSQPRRVDGGRAGAQTLSWADAHGNGTLGIVWLEADTDGRPDDLSGAWQARYARVTDAHGPQATAQVSTVFAAPVHRGPICLEGPGCEEGDDRRLLDFAWTAFDAAGRAHVVVPSTTTQAAPRPVPVYAVADVLSD